MTAWYNEIDLHCADTLRNLIRKGLIADGEVDTRSIRDVRPADIAGFDQCHFFAGLGLWSLALRWADWPDDCPVWTGSCPCQPFSQAGSRAGFDDERHLWPDWFWLIDQHRPDTIFGEQVESTDGRLWLDLVCTDLEARDYACGPVVFPSAGVGAPNLRHRLFWVADSGRSSGCAEHQHEPGVEAWRGTPQDHPGRSRARSPDGGMADAQGDGRHQQQRIAREPACAREFGQRQSADSCVSCGRTAEGRPAASGGLGNASNARLPNTEPCSLEEPRRRGEGRATEQSGGPRDPWSVLEWIDCADGKRRPTQPGIFPLAPRHPGDVAKLRAYGNAINPVVAAEVIRSFMERGA